MRIGMLLILATVLAGCGSVPVESPDAAWSPAGPIEAHGPPATGPIIELGSGGARGLDWRYAIYPSDEGWCAQMEFGGLTGVNCGTGEPADGQAFASVNHTETGVDEQLVAVDGVVSADAATVWLIADGGRGPRIPAMLMPLGEAGIDAQAFVGLPPPDMNVTHVMAVALNGKVLETYELP